MRKRMYLIPAGFILFILFFTVFGERGLLRIYHLSKDRQELQKKAGELRTENDRMKREIEALKGDRQGQYSIRINQQWRVCFEWREDGPHNVEIVDYH